MDTTSPTDSWVFKIGGVSYSEALDEEAKLAIDFLCERCTNVREVVGRRAYRNQLRAYRGYGS